MDEYADVWVLIPIYNEEESVVVSVIEEVTRAGYKNICIVDDGSLAPFVFVPQNGVNLCIVRHAINRGKGAALKTGIKKVQRMHGKIIVTMDGDGQHDPQDIRHMLAKIDEGYNVVLGSRLEYESDMPLYKRIANYVGNAVTWVFFGLWVRDSQSGLRAYDAQALRKMNTQTDGYAFDSEVIREIARHQLRYVEVPINVRYTEYSMNKPTRQTVMGGIKMILHMINIR